MVSSSPGMKDLRNKVVVISGAGSGIGRALALHMAQAGAHLSLNDLDPEALRTTVEQVVPDTPILALPVDVSDRSAVQRFAQATMDRHGRVDVVVNNAGIGMGRVPFHEMDLGLFDRMMAVNFQGVLHGCHAFLPHLLQRPESALVNLSSIFGLAGIAYNTAYCASKFAVHGLSQALQQEYRGTGLVVHSVHPGGVNTGITRNALAPSAEGEAFHQRFLKRAPEQAASVIVRGIRRKQRRILIGAEALQLDVAVRLMPDLGADLVNAIIRRQVEQSLNRP